MDDATGEDAAILLLVVIGTAVAFLLVWLGAQ